MKEKLFELINKCFSKPESEEFTVDYKYKPETWMRETSYSIRFTFKDNPPLEIFKTIIQQEPEYKKESVYILSNKWEEVIKLVNELENNFSFNGSRNQALIKPVFVSFEGMKDYNKSLPTNFIPGYDIEKKYSTAWRRFFLGDMWVKGEARVKYDRESIKKFYITFGHINEAITEEEWNDCFKKLAEFNKAKSLDKLNKRIQSI